MYIFLFINLTILFFICIIVVYLRKYVTDKNTEVKLKTDEIKKLNSQIQTLSNKVKIVEGKATDVIAFLENIIDNRIAVAFAHNFRREIYGDAELLKDSAYVDVMIQSIALEVSRLLTNEYKEILTLYYNAEKVDRIIMETIFIKVTNLVRMKTLNHVSNITGLDISTYNNTKGDKK